MMLAAGLMVTPAIGSLSAATNGIVSPASSDTLAKAGRSATYFTFCAQRDPVRLGYDPFYARHCEAQGLDVLASAAVAPSAIRRTAEIVVDMIGHRQDILDEMISRNVRVAVIAHGEVTSDMPEYRDLYERFPDVDWDVRARGLGATAARPLSSVGEENILCDPTDPYVGSSIMVHEFAHTIAIMGVRHIDPTFEARIGAAYSSARFSGLWSNTYAGSNQIEYWAETVMSYFDTNIDGPVGGDGIHNQIDTRAELALYDPRIYAIIDEIFGAAAPLGLCNG